MTDQSTMPLRVYVASSWRNQIQPAVVELVRVLGHEVYDFRNPAPGNDGFRWTDADPDFVTGGPDFYIGHIESNRVARRGFELDKAALDWCNVCVMVLPCGRSAHLEAGYACGQGKTVLFLLSASDWEPELMYLLGSGFCRTLEDLTVALRHLAHHGRYNYTVRGFGTPDTAPPGDDVYAAVAHVAGISRVQAKNAVHAALYSGRLSMASRRRDGASVDHDDGQVDLEEAIAQRSLETGEPNG
jgi:hypothetical protein